MDNSELQIEMLPETDQDIRLAIVKQMGNSEIDGRILIENMETVFQWVKLGAVPKSEEKQKKKKLEVVKDTSSG